MPDTPLDYLEKKLLCKEGNATAIFRSHGKPATFSKSRFRDYDGTIAEQVEGSIGGRSSVLGWWLPKEQSFVVRCPHGVLPLWAFGFLEASACGYALLEEEADEKMDEKFPSLAALQEARPDIEAKLSTPDAAGEARDVALREILCLRQREPRFSNGTTDDIDLALCSMSRSVRASLVARIAGNDEALVRHGRRLIECAHRFGAENLCGKGEDGILASLHQESRFRRICTSDSSFFFCRLRPPPSRSCIIDISKGKRTRAFEARTGEEQSMAGYSMEGITIIANSLDRIADFFDGDGFLRSMNGRFYNVEPLRQISASEWKTSFGVKGVADRQLLFKELRNIAEGCPDARIIVVSDMEDGGVSVQGYFGGCSEGSFWTVGDGESIDDAKNDTDRTIEGMTERYKSHVAAMGGCGMRRVCADEIVHIPDYGDAEIAATFASPYDAMECGFCEPMGEIQNWKIVGMCKEGKRPLFAACRDEENLIESIANDTRIKLIEWDADVSVRLDGRPCELSGLWPFERAEILRRIRNGEKSGSFTS